MKDEYQVVVKGKSSFAAIFLAVAALIFFYAGSAEAKKYSGGNVSLLLGQKYLDESYWTAGSLDVSDQILLGVEIDYAGKKWPVSALLGLSYSSTDDNHAGTTFDGSTSELYIGARKYFSLERNLIPEANKISPYVSGGLSMVSTTFSASGYSFEEDYLAYGAFAGGGALYRIGRFNVGLDLRLLFEFYTDAEYDENSSDYLQGAITVGYRFGKRDIDRIKKKF